MLSIDESAGTTYLLHFGDDLQRQRRFARRFRSIDFNDATTWQAADAQCNI